MRDMLEQYLERIISITISTEVDLQPIPPADSAHLLSNRMRMARILTAYQLFVHRELYQPLHARREPGDADRARQLKTECMELADALRRHMSLWSGRDLASSWSEYRPAELAMIERVRENTQRVRAAAQWLDGEDAAPEMIAADTVPSAARSSFGRQMARYSL
jgi:hypothetical protein